MQDAEWESALADDQPITPSSGFSLRVMEAVRRDARRQRLRFSWPIVFSTLGISATLVVMTVWAGSGVAESAGMDRVADAVGWISVTSAMSALTAWWSLRLASRG
jgi:hypothetical protein